MTSPVDGNDVFGLLNIQYTYRFIGKTRGNEGVSYDMTKIEDVRKAYLAHNKQRSRSQTEIRELTAASTVQLVEP